MIDVMSVRQYLKQSQTIFSQISRFFVVGLVVYGADFATFYFLLYCELFSDLGSNLFAKAVGGLVGFFLHKTFTYSWKKKNGTSKQLLRYIGAMILNAILANMLLYVLVLASFPTVAAKLLSDIVVVATSFLLGRWFIFTKSNI